MFGLRLPSVIMMLLAMLSATMVINRMLEGSGEEAVRDQASLDREAPGASRAHQLFADTILQPEQQQTSPAIHSATGSSDRMSERRQTPLRPLISIEVGRLSIDAHEAPLEMLLAEISNQSGIAISYEGPGEQTISIAFQDLPLEAGLRRILERQDVFLFYGAGGSEPTTVWVYPRGQGHKIVPAPPETWAATAEFEQELSSPSWGTRTQAIEAVIERKGRESVEAVFYALSDPNHNVRYSALSGALDIGMALPAGTLENLAQYDRSHFVRALAVKALGEDREADRLAVTSMAQAALADRHPDVRAQARDILATVNDIGDR